MPRNPSGRKYQLTINNPLDHGFHHEHIKELLEQFQSLQYWCMCDEVGKEGTPHTHVYVVFKNPVMFTTLQPRFYGAHIEIANGSNLENRDYVRKEGKWTTNEKRETNLTNTFEEYGTLPPDRAKGKSDSEAILQMVKDGASNAQIIEAFPSAMNRLQHIEKSRQTLLEERYRETFRNLEVCYLYGDTGAGKTRSVMERFGYSNVFRATNYAHPFDNYQGQDVVIFEEFRSSLPIGDMLNYLDGYPVDLPCRYADKVACYTKVFIISNIPLEQQYCNIQEEQPETYKAFLRRIGKVEQLSHGQTQTLVPLYSWIEDPFKTEEKGEACSTIIPMC